MNNRSKYLRYGIGLAMIALLGYKSVYFEKLSTHQKKGTAASFDAAGYSQKLWREQMPARLESAPLLSDLIAAVNKGGDSALEKYSHALAIGNYRYALIKGEATVEELGEDELKINCQSGDSSLSLTLATEFIFGNAIRDASGLVQVKDFPNTSDLNSISESLNAIVRKEVIPGFRKTVKKGDRVQFVAAVELNKAHLRWQGLELIPVKLTIMP